MKELSNTEAELKKSVAYTKKACNICLKKEEGEILGCSRRWVPVSSGRNEPKVWDGGAGFC